MVIASNFNFHGHIYGRLPDGKLSDPVYVCKKGDLAIMKRLNSAVKEHPDSASVSVCDGFRKKVMFEIEKNLINAKLRIPWLEALYMQVEGEQKAFLKKENIEKFKSLIFELDTEEFRIHKHGTLFPAELAKVKKFERYLLEHLRGEAQMWFIKYFR